MLRNGRIIHYDGRGLLYTIGEIDLKRAAQLGADGWCTEVADDADAATWQELGRTTPEGGAPKVKLEVVIKKCAVEPLALGDLGTARQQELKMMLMGAVETTFASKYRMIGNAYFDRVALLMGNRTPLLRAPPIQEQHRCGDEEWSLAFPIGKEQGTGKELQLNSGYKSTLVHMNGKLWLQIDLGCALIAVCTASRTAAHTAAHTASRTAVLTDLDTASPLDRRRAASRSRILRPTASTWLQTRWRSSGGSTRTSTGRTTDPSAG